MRPVRPTQAAGSSRGPTRIVEVSFRISTPGTPFMGLDGAPLVPASPRRHGREIAEFLVEHLADHADLLVLKLLQQRRRLVVRNVRLALLIAEHEYAQRDI